MENNLDTAHGSAVVFWHQMKANPPAATVRAIAITDLRPTTADGPVCAGRICEARVLDNWYPCIVIEMDERTLIQNN